MPELHWGAGSKSRIQVSLAERELVALKLQLQRVRMRNVPGRVDGVSPNDIHPSNQGYGGSPICPTVNTGCAHPPTVIHLIKYFDDRSVQLRFRLPGYHDFRSRHVRVLMWLRYGKNGPDC